MTQRIQKQVSVLPAVESELHLFQIDRQLFRADMVPCSHYSSLEKRGAILNGVGVNISNYVELM
jgi:hypothetical protein